MALLRRSATPPPEPTIHPRPNLGHAGANAFCDELRSGDHETALRRYYGLPSGQLREFYVSAATDEDMLDDGEPRAPQWADALVERFPGAAVAWTIRGGTKVAAAWAARGGGRAHTVDESAWPTFFEQLNEAEQDLHRAIAMDADDPTPWIELLPAGMGLQIPKEEIRARYDEAVRRAPDLFRAHGLLLQALCAKWGGAHEEMFRFARTVATASPDGSLNHVLVIEAHLEQWIDLGCKPSEYFPRGPVKEIRTAAARSVMHPAFVDTPQFPYAASARNVATVGLVLASQQRDGYEQAVLIGDRLAKWPWVYIGDPADRLAYVLHKGPR